MSLCLPLQQLTRISLIKHSFLSGMRKCMQIVLVWVWRWLLTSVL